MNRIVRTLIAAALCVACASLAPTTAHARRQTGLGVGANLTLGGFDIPTGLGGTSLPFRVSGLALPFWVMDDLMLEFMAGVGFQIRDPGDAPFSIGGSVGVFGVLAQGDDTNFSLGGRVGVVALINFSGAAMADDNQAGVTLDGVIRVEHWFDDHFAINAQVGVGITILPDTGIPVVANLTATTGFFGGAGFTYYLDASGRAAGGSGSPPPPPAAAAGSTTTAQPAAATAQSGERPYWEEQ
jgi:hypothetical protein